MIKLFEKAAKKKQERESKTKRALDALDHIDANDVKELVGDAIKCLPPTPRFAKVAK